MVVAATGKLRQPSSVLVRGTSMSRRSAERRCARPEMSEVSVQTCLKYAGPVLRIQLKAAAATLYSIRWRTGSQWNTSRRTG